MKVAKLLAAATAFGYVCIGIAAYALAADVTASGGRNADGDRTVIITTVDNSYTVNAGSVVRTNENVILAPQTPYLDRLSVNGISYKVFSETDLTAQASELQSIEEKIGNADYSGAQFVQSTDALSEVDVKLDKAVGENRSAIAVNASDIQRLQNRDVYLDNRIDKVDGRIDKVGAGAAALAALHPLDFDADNKLSFAAGIGNYGSETACSLGMFYWPTESVMMSLGGTYGNDENMLNVGVSFALDRRAEIAKEMSATEKELAEMREELARLTAIVDELTKQKEQA